MDDKSILILKILFEIYEDSIVPVIYSKNSDTLTQLNEHLTNNSVEVIKRKCSLLIYTKLYTDKEMNDMKAGSFHPGFNIKTFFEKFPDLIKYIDLDSYSKIKDFLSENEIIDDLLTIKKI
jgi:hypothetical protein